MKKSLLCMALGALLAAPSFAADTYTIDTNHSEVSFQVRHLVSKVRGTFADFQGTVVMDAEKPAASSVEFAIEAKSINTNNEKRDNHLRSADFFDVEKHAQITFKSTKVEAAGKDKYNVTGTLNMHGVAKDITLPVAFNGFIKGPAGNTVAGFETSVTLNRKDYGIVWNRTLDEGGLVLGEDVMVTIAIAAGQKKPEPAATK